MQIIQIKKNLHPDVAETFLNTLYCSSSSLTSPAITIATTAAVGTVAVATAVNETAIITVEASCVSPTESVGPLTGIIGGIFGGNV